MGFDSDMSDNAHKASTSPQGSTANKRRKSSTTFLSEEEKKARHIASEKKRREAIRVAFDRIVSLVPDLTPAESRTEVAVLTKSANYINDLKAENQRLLELLQLQNVEIPQHLINAFAATNGDPETSLSNQQTTNQQ